MHVPSNARTTLVSTIVVVVTLLSVGVADAATPRPTGLTATATSSTAITLRWTDASSNEIGFEIQRSPGNKSTFKKIGTAPTNATTYPDTGLTAATAYKYRVRALKPPTGASSFSNVATATTLGGTTTTTTTTSTTTSTTTTTTPSTTLPSVPTGLVASPVSGSCSSIIVDWNASTPGTNGLKDYVLWRDGTFLKYVTAPTTITTDSGLTGARAYSYAVQARDTVLNPSAKSASVAATTPTCGTTTVPTPSGLKADATSCGFAVASWNPIYDPSGTHGIAKYKLYRNGVAVKTVNAPATTVVDTSLAPLTTYTYSVTAVNGSNQESATSATVNTTTPACPPPGASSRTAGGTGPESSNSVAVDPDGNIVIAGTFGQTANFGGGNVVASANGDMYVAKYSPTFALLWVKHFPSGTNSNELNNVATDAAGNVYLAGAFFGTLNLGGTNLVNPTAGMRDAFVAKFSADGTHQWSRRYGSTKEDVASDIAIDSGGNAVVTGWFWGTGVDFGNGHSLSNTNGIFGGADGFILKLSNATTPTTLMAVATPCGGAFPYGLALDASDNVFITGYVRARCNFGSGFLPAYNDDAFVFKYSASGANLWAKVYGAPWHDEGTSVAVDSSGNTIVTGMFAEVVDFGTGPLGRTGATPWAFVVKLAGNNGATLWSKAFGAPIPTAQLTSATGTGVAIDAQGEITVVGSFAGTIDFGGGPLTVPPFANGSSAKGAYVVQYTAAGVHIDSDRYGSANAQGRDVANGPTGAVVTGWFNDPIDLGFGPVASNGLSDVFMLNTGR